MPGVLRAYVSRAKAEPFLTWLAASATGLGVLTFGAKWPYVVLAPVFIVGGTLVGAGTCIRHVKTLASGFGVLTCGACARAVATWGASPSGAGSRYIGGWLWGCISVGLLLTARRTASRGLP